MKVSERQLQDAYSKAQQAGSDFARLNVADAAARIRGYFTAAEVVRFDLYEGEAGWVADLVSIRDAKGGLLWHVDTGEACGLGDDSTVTDRLATAEAWGHDYFPRARDQERVVSFTLSGCGLREVRISDALRA